MNQPLKDQPLKDQPLKVEPSADQRAAGIECFRLFVALVDGGFTEDQALKIVGAMLGGQR